MYVVSKSSKMLKSAWSAFVFCHRPVKPRMFNAIQRNPILNISTNTESESYETGPDLFIVGWLSGYNQNGNKDVEVPGMQLNIDAIQTS